MYAFLGVAFIVLRQLPSSLEVTTPLTLERSSVLTHPHPQIVLDRATTCNNNDGNGIVAATSALRAWANNGTHARALGLGNFYGKTLTMGSLIRIHPCVTLYDGSTRVRDFVLIVMGSAKERLRLEIMQRLWSRSATDAGARIIYVSDAEDAALGTITLPGAREPSYAGAQNRSLKGLQYAVAQYPDARWYWMVDDDTYVSRRLNRGAAHVTGLASLAPCFWITTSNRIDIMIKAYAIEAVNFRRVADRDTDRYMLRCHL